MPYTLTCYDAVDVAALPAGGTDYLGYIDGRYTSTNWVQVRYRFPGARIHTVTTVGTPGARIADGETGDLPPQGLAAWARNEIRESRRPTGYCGAASWDAYLRAAAEAGIPAGGMDWIVAHYDGIAAIPAGAVGKQYSTGAYDTSIILASWADPTAARPPAVATTSPPAPARPPVVHPPQPIPGDAPAMKIPFECTTGADGTAEIPIDVPAGLQLLGGWVDVLDPSAYNPARQDGDYDPATRTGVQCAPTVGGKAGPRLRVVHAIPGHFYTGRALVG